MAACAPKASRFLQSRHEFQVKALKREIQASPSPLRVTDQFTVTSEGDYQCQLWREGAPTGIRLDGAKLQAAVAWLDLFLLVITDENGYEDFVNLHLLDAHLKILDTASVGSPYNSGQFGGLALAPPNQLTFSFPGEAHAWRITLYEKPRLSRPLLPFSGVWRSLTIRRHFDVRMVSQSAKGGGKAVKL